MDAHRNRPSIWQTGRIHDNGDTITVTGWGLGLCATGCDCHRSPSQHTLQIAQDDQAGTLGLVSHRPDCVCCQPWTLAELAAILRDLADAAALQSRSKETS